MDELMEWVRQAKERDEIREVIRRSLMDMDRLDLEQGPIHVPDECFTEDGRVLIGGRQIRGPGSTPRQPDEFPRVAYTHFAGPTEITLDGDTARTETYAIAWVIEDRDGKHILLVRSIRYLDRFVKKDGCWLIDERRHNLDWQFEAEPSFSVTRKERAIRDW
jgi:hypothetical protein